MYSRPKKELRPEAALIRLETLCARAEQCESELRRKLATWQIAPDDADAIIISLRSRRFVDDSRYAAAFVRDKYRFARWGRRKIEMALRQKRIDPDVAAEAMTEIDDKEYLSILRHIITAKAKPMAKPLAYEDRMKLLRFAVGRGYESAQAVKIIIQLGAR